MSHEARPRIVLVSLRKEWLGISRLPESLSENGLEIVAICQKGSFLGESSYIDKLHFIPPPKLKAYTRLIGIKILSILHKEPCDRVIPGDEDTVYALYDVMKLAKTLKIRNVQKVLEASISSTNTDHIINKYKFFSLLQEVSVPIPAQLGQIDVYKPQKDEFPLVVKDSYSSGGSGVSIVYSQSEFHDASVRNEKSWIRKSLSPIKCLFFYDIFSFNSKPRAEKYIDGDISMYPFLAEKGELIGGFSVRKAETFPKNIGPSTVIESFICPDMEEYAKVIVEKTRFTGFGSIDFIVERVSKRIYVIELNPRPVPASHLGSIFGSDLCKLFSSLCRHQEPSPKKELKENIRVSLFPNEVLRDKNSNNLVDAIHDVPWNDEGLLRKINNTYGLSFTLEDN
ncbi:hypothetical protein [Pseudobacteriovorax antillogorgiicola]|uniref:Carbamoyl-phosphate synthase L chain, ATP binding domain n=1 Tax=Pseudobacteriovorax antillogorgiicola TaxID=1513793 RepID=A0A1Y6BLX4_9BACT|nr:hypothetical protein [Pseudobacteriovorax antillogorgiicola]TCS54545.1 carbamoyl-phosphate synthase L subunit-like protein [Pseudobacteriovorax antillogorgiicola]SMF18536.1 Carbamoyl-phosphate synthase L chain, ATP binding domain [Pseudobacteriovorax antillogorgiicola]